jgi:heme/copper-type cytochrome/quinol oxidase subunit 2
VFEGVAGGFAVIILIGLICVVLFGTGWYLIVKYNKKGTKYFQEIQPMQYVGIVLCVLACLPFIQYFFLGFLAEAGGSVFDSLFE